MQIHFTFAETVNLQPDESFRVRLVHIFVDEILDQIAVDPGLNAWSTRNDPQRVPAFVDKVVMAGVDLLL